MRAAACQGRPGERLDSFSSVAEANHEPAWRLQSEDTAKVPTPEKSLSPACKTHAEPRSTIFTFIDSLGLCTSFESMALLGFRSRWTKPRLCMDAFFCAPLPLVEASKAQIEGVLSMASQMWSSNTAISLYPSGVSCWGSGSVGVSVSGNSASSSIWIISMLTRLSSGTSLGTGSAGNSRARGCVDSTCSAGSPSSACSLVSGLRTPSRVGVSARRHRHVLIVHQGLEEGQDLLRLELESLHKPHQQRFVEPLTLPGHSHHTVAEPQCKRIRSAEVDDGPLEHATALDAEAEPEPRKPTTTTEPPDTEVEPAKLRRLFGARLRRQMRDLGRHWKR